MWEMQERSEARSDRAGTETPAAWTFSYCCTEFRDTPSTTWVMTRRLLRPSPGT